MHAIAMNDHREVAELLIRYGAEVDSKDLVSTPPNDTLPSHYIST